jgi:hypothetical protein
MPDIIPAIKGTAWVWAAVGFGVVLSLAIHEFAHAAAYKKAHVRIERISLFGLPIPYRLNWHIPLPLRFKAFPEASVGIYPIPLGAFIMANRADVSQVPMHVVRTMAMAGPISNMLLTVICVICMLSVEYFFLPRAMFLKGTWIEQFYTDEFGFTYRYWDYKHYVDYYVLAVACISQFGVLIFMLRDRRWLPVTLVVISTVWLVTTVTYFNVEATTRLLTDVQEGTVLQGFVEGSSKIDAIGSDFVAAGAWPATFFVFFVLSAINFLLAALNMVPGCAGDGSMILGTYVPQRYLKLYVIVVAGSMLLLNVGILLADPIVWFAKAVRFG